MLTERMNIRSPVGTRVVFDYPEGGYDADIEQAKRWLTLGVTYTIARTEVHNWHTKVWLEEFPDQSFNSVHFGVWADKEPSK